MALHSVDCNWRVNSSDSAIEMLGTEMFLFLIAFSLSFFLFILMLEVFTLILICISVQFNNLFQRNMTDTNTLKCSIHSSQRKNKS